MDANRQLIKRMEHKIAATLVRIWGEEPEQAEERALTQADD